MSKELHTCVNNSPTKYNVGNAMKNRLLFFQRYGNFLEITCLPPKCWSLLKLLWVSESLCNSTSGPPNVMAISAAFTWNGSRLQYLLVYLAGHRSKHLYHYATTSNDPHTQGCHLSIQDLVAAKKEKWANSQHFAYSFCLLRNPIMISLHDKRLYFFPLQLLI